METGALLKAWRKWRGLSQEELAAQTGISRDQIAKIETGRRKLSAGELLKIAAREGGWTWHQWFFDGALDYPVVLLPESPGEPSFGAAK